MNIYVMNEYEILYRYLMVYPCNFQLNNNENQEKIDKAKAYAQYNQFINFLTEQGIKISFLDIINSSEQIFTRDIGFVINDIFIVSKLKSPERANETQPLMKFIEKNQLKYYQMQNPIEGGDVIHFDKTLFIGIGNRTNMEAVLEVQKVLNDNGIQLQVIPIKYDVNKIHLDCAFNTLDHDSCVITEYVYDVNIIKKYFKNCILLGKAEADELGANFVYLGENKLVTHSQGTKNLLSSYGFDCYFIDYSEIIKANGSLGCCTLPIFRSN